MALILDGNGLIQGLDAGGLPSGSVNADSLASTLDLSSKTMTFPSGSVNADTLASTLDLSSKTMTFGNVSASGITFPASISASSNANTLDDYEEGTWTPATSSVGYTISASSGAYTKIGRQVFLRFQVTFSAVGGNTSAFTLTAAPFTAGGFQFSGTGRDCVTSGAIYVAHLPANSTTFNINSYSGISSGSARTFATGEEYVFSFNYFV